MPSYKLSAKAVFLSLACACSCGATSASPTPEEIALRSSSALELQQKAIKEFPWRDFSQTASLLENREYDRYEALLKRYMTEWGDAPDKEHSQHLLFETTNAGDANQLHRLNEWITKKPSAIAFLARGAYLNRRGQLLRGGAPTSATPALNLELLAAVHQRASTDLHQAINLDPGLLPAYSHLLEVARFSPGLKIDTEKLLAAATRHHPLNVGARKRYLDILSPAWGGSFEAMERFAHSFESMAETNPLLWTLKARVHYEKAASLPRSEAKQKIAELTTALSYAKLSRYYESRAQAHLTLEQHGEAIADLERCALREGDFVRGQSEPMTSCRTLLVSARASALAARRAEEASLQGEKK